MCRSVSSAKRMKGLSMHLPDTLAEHLDDDHLHEECGIFGVFHPGEDVANLTYFGLYSLQHRGQESAGIAVSDGRDIHMHKEMGLVSQVFDQDNIAELLTAALPRAEGAYCLLFLTRDSLVAARDPLGIRPLCLGRFGEPEAPGGTGYVIASETCALDVIGASFICEIDPGEIVSID